MSAPEPLIPPSLERTLIKSLNDLVQATQAATAATVAAAIISKKQGSLSINEAMEICHDVQMAMYPPTSGGNRDQWEKTKNARLGKVHH